MISFISSLSSLDLNQLAFANDLTGPATAFLEMDGLMDSALVIGQAAKWLPTWLRPLWVIAVGLVWQGVGMCSRLRGPSSSVLHSSSRSTCRLTEARCFCFVGRRWRDCWFTVVPFCTTRRNLSGVALSTSRLHRCDAWLRVGLRCLVADSIRMVGPAQGGCRTVLAGSCRSFRVDWIARNPACCSTHGFFQVHHRGQLF